MADSGDGTDLPALLERHREEIASAWTEAVVRGTSSHYREREPAELRAWAKRALHAIGEALAADSRAPLDAYLADISSARLRQGFDIGEVIEGLLLLRNAIVPFVQAGRDPAAGTTAAVLEWLDATVRYLVARFGHTYAEAMNRSLQAQQERTALMLDAVQMASSSLDLDEVLRRVAQALASAVAPGFCVIYALEDGKPSLVPRAAAGPSASSGERISPDRLSVAIGGLLAEALERVKPVVCQRAECHPRIDAEESEALGLQSLLAVPIEIGGRVLGVAALVSFDEDRVFGEAEVELALGVANSVALAIDNARLFEETRGLYEETNRRLAESLSLQRVISALLQRPGLGDVLQVVCEEAQRLIGATGAAVLLLERDESLRVARSTGSSQPTFERLPVDGSLSGYAVRSGEPLLINEPQRHPQWQRQHWDVEPSSLLVVPLRVKGKVIGTLNLVHKPDGFSADDLRVIGLFADQAAIAIENARLYQQEEQLVVVQERQRIARELHDSVAQGLYSVALYAEAAGRLLARGNVARAAERINEILEITRESLRDMRLLIFELRPPVLESEGLVAALQARLEAVEGRAGVRTDLLVEGDRRLPGHVEEEIYRIAQEALTNILKHARAKHVAVRLSLGEENLRLQITDDGVGFDPQAVGEKSGLGLRGIAERAQRIGGKLRVRSAPGKGTTIDVEVGLKGFVL